MSRRNSKRKRAPQDAGRWQKNSGEQRKSNFLRCCVLVGTCMTWLYCGRFLHDRVVVRYGDEVCMIVLLYRTNVPYYGL